MSKDDDKLIVCFATKRIDDPLPTNCQQLMSRLAHHFKVLYIEPPVDPIFILRNPQFIMKLFFAKPFHAKNLKILCPIILPFASRLPKLVEPLNSWFLGFVIKLYLIHRGSSNIIAWLFKPQDLFVALATRPNFIIYHVTDKYREMARFAKNDNTKREIDTIERETIKHADIIFCTSISLYKEISQVHSRAIYVGNVANTEHFSKSLSAATSLPSDIRHLPGPIIGFFGAINDFKLDFDLVSASAAAIPEGSVVMIGPFGNHGKDLQLIYPLGRNIFFLGLKSYNELPSYLKAFDVCIIPFRISAYTKHVYPLKFFEYMASGKPIVSTSLPALQQYGRLCYFADTPKDWKAAIKMALDETDVELRKARRLLAEKKSWVIRTRHIAGIIDRI